MNEEIMRILKMVEEKKITSDEAAKLIDAINAKKSESEWIDLNQPLIDDKTQEDTEATPGKKPSWLFILVERGDKKNVRVRIPIKLARWALRFVPKHAHVKMKEEFGQDFDVSELGEIIDQLPTNENLVDVFDDESGERVRIFVR